VSDKFLMRLLLDKDTLGIYSANYKFGTILLMLVIAFRTAWQPFFLKIADRDEAKSVYARVLTYFTLVGVVIIVLVTFFIEYLVQIPLPGSITILGQNYWSGISVIPVILTSYLFFGMYVNFTVGVYIKKKTRLMFVFTGLAAIVNIVSNLYLMPAYGIMGAAIATLLSYLVMALSIFIANQAIYPIIYEYKRIFLLVGYLVIMLIIYYFWTPGLSMRIILVLTTPFIFMLAGFFNRAEVLTFKSLLKKVK
jgi:O-antigen/teichoic acid export membrane protein